MNELSFGAPGWLWALLAVPLLTFFYVRAERRGVRRLQEFVAAKLLPQLAATVNRRRRALKFALLLLGLGLSLVALAKPRLGYTYEDVKRKGLDLLLAIDTSRSMLSNDVQPNRLQRVKLSTQDLIAELQGDRVGLIAFAGRAFLQAPLTIDYDAAVEAINDIDTNTIPEGGTNISEAINLGVQTFGKSATGNRALVVFTDGEELSGDAIKTAKAAADAGVRIFTIGVGTPEGSLIPINGEGGGTAFVKDSKGQVVKSKLDEQRLAELAQATGGKYLHLEGGPQTMRRLFADGLSKMQTGEIDARISRRPIERFQWPLGAALAAIAGSILIRDRRRIRNRVVVPASSKSRMAMTMAAVVIGFTHYSLGASPGLEAYRSEKYPEAYQQFDETLKQHPQNPADDKLRFDAGAAAYKMKDYGKALDSFSQALLSPDAGLQSRSHYNLGNTLYQRGETQKTDDKKLSDWTNALQHYEQTLKLDPKNAEAKDNSEFVKKKIEDLKNKKNEPPAPTPTPTPSATPKQDKDKKDQKNQPQDKGDKPKKDEQQQDKQKQDQADQQQQQKDQSGKSDDQQDQSKSGDKGKGDEKKDPSEDKNAAESPSPSSSPSPGDQTGKSGGGGSPSPSPSEKGDQKDQAKSNGGDQTPEQSPTPGDEGAEASSPSPSAGNGSDAGTKDSPAPSPSSSPGKKPAGEVKGAGEEQATESDKAAQIAQGEAEKDGQMSEKQAEALLRSMKDEEKRVQLDERKAARHVYNDW